MDDGNGTQVPEGVGTLTLPSNSLDGSPADAPSPSRGSSSELRRAGLALGASLGVLLVIALFIAGYSSAFGRPEPHNIPVAVVGTTSSVSALGATSALQTQRTASTATATDLIDHRTVYGAFVLSTPHEVTLLVAGGAGHSVESALDGIAQQMATSNDLHLVVHDVAPTTANDPSGTVEFYAIIFLGIGGAIGATLLGRILAKVATVRDVGRRLAVLVLYAAALSAVGVLMSDVVYGALVGHAGLVFLVFWAFATAVAVACTGVASVAGTAGSLTLALTLTILGNTTAGGAVGRPLLNGFYSFLTPMFPHGAALTVLRGVQYFHGRDIADGLVCLAIWTAVGVLLLGVGAAAHGERARPAAQPSAPGLTAVPA